MPDVRPAGSVVFSSSASSSSSGGGGREISPAMGSSSGVRTAAENSQMMLEGNKQRTCTAETLTEEDTAALARKEGNVNSVTVQQEDLTATVPIPPAPVKVWVTDSEIKPGMRVLFRLPRRKTITTTTTTTTTTLLEMGSTTEWQLGTVIELSPCTDDDNDDNDYSQDGHDDYDDKSRGCVTSSNDIIAVIISLTGRFSEERPLRAKLRYVRRYSYDGSPFDLNDLSILPEPSDAALLYSLRERFFEGLHYTFVGRVMLAVNPYQHSEYSPNVPHPRQVSRTARDLLLTHKSSNFDNNNNSIKESTSGGNIYDTVRTGAGDRIEKKSTHSLTVKQRPVALIVTGDSGAGKTETAKLVLSHFLAESVSGMKTSSSLSTSGTSENVSKRILGILEATNCLLESFGNASTPLNDNSSRFAKCVTVLVDPQTGEGVGARIECYLLEVSRLVSRLSGESTFHIFSMMFANREGLTPEEQHRFDIWDPTLFRSMYSGAGNVYLGALPYTFSQVRAALELVGLDNEKIDSVIRILSGILHLLNVEFAARDLFAPAFILPKSISACKKAAELLGFSSTNEHDSLETMLTTVRLGGEIRHLHSAAAESTRDSLAKHLYDSLFQYILHVINKALLPINTEVEQYSQFSLLDIFGFEVKEQKYGNNDLEQLLINYTNEVVQHLYEETNFDSLFTEALREGVQLEIPREDDQHHSGTYNIFVQKPHGILNIINDDSLLSQRSLQEGGKNLATMLTSLQKSFPYLIKPHRTDPTKVSIQHYCAKVLYDTENMSAKNRISTAASLICATSTDNFILDICKTISSLPTGQHSSPITEGGIGLFSPRSHAATLISRFRTQLEGIISQLKTSELLWIRCIKPNSKKHPDEFDSTLVLSQLKSGAVLKSLMLFGKGYCHSFGYKDFVRNYLSLAVRGYCCDALGNSSSSKDIYTSSSTTTTTSSSFSTRRVFEKSKLRESSFSHIRLQQVAPYYDAVYRASLREACFLVTQLIPCCMNNALLLGSSKVFMRSSTLRNLLELGDVAKEEAIQRIERVGRAYIERCSLATIRFSKLREKRLAAIRDRIAEEMPKREILEVERESMLMKSCEGRAELLASLSRQAMKSSKRVEKQWKESMELMKSELQKSFDELFSYETLRLRKEKEVRDEAAIEKMYKARAWEAVEREWKQRRRVEMARRQAVKNSTAVTHRSCADVAAERVKAIQREIIHARRIQLRAEQEVLLERRQREVQLREQREAKEVRRHLDRQQRRIAEEARRREEMTQRQLIAGSLPRSDHSCFTVSGVDKRITSGDLERDHTVCGLVMSPSSNVSRTASQMSLPFAIQKERRTGIEKDGCDPEVEWAIQKDMMALWESLQSRTSV
ncbi:Myosin head [Trypanosoma melophagium]|uniref:Myosin head n=1 Tax=Trypanosoma melophagium TaxID=715481 RepID=UPI00351A01A5|nr:Myosin head [Trypanosoma melophagium]